MIKNYLLFVFRNFKRSPGFLSINIVGLAVGIATVLLITLYVQHELSFDQYHEKKDRVFRLIDYAGFDEKSWDAYVAGDPTAEMRKSYTEVEDATKFMNCGPDYIRLGETRYNDLKMLCAQSGIFNIFSFDLISGKSDGILDAPNRIVISESLAQRMYGDQEPLGQTIPVALEEDPIDFEVVGVMKDIPVNSHFRTDLFISYSSLESTRRCLSCGQAMYTLLREDADPDTVASRVLSHIREIDGRSYVEDVKLEPLTEVYFSKWITNPQGNLRYIYIMSGIAFLVLMIGCANYMNLSTARFSQRSKEIGVRKVLGANRMELVKQFLLESVVITVLALPIALILLSVALPYFNDLAGTEITLDWLSNISLYSAMFLLVVVIALLAGSYPAVFLSSFKPSEVIKGTLRPGFSAANIRKGLVVFQFLVAIVMIVVTTVIMDQLYYMQEKNLGFDSDQVVVASLTDSELGSKYLTVREEFEKLAFVKEASASMGVPIQRGGSHYIHELEDGTNVSFVTPTIDENFLSTMEVDLVAGRNVSTTIPEGRGIEVIISTKGVEEMGWDSNEEALEQEIGYYKIVGVVEDFHIKPLDEEIQPILLSQNRWGRSYVMLIKLKGGNIGDALESLRTTWDEMGATEPLDVRFLDDQIDQLYEKEQNIAKTIGTFAFLSIFVGCIGLFGLITFSTEQRVKEIGIRKVLGASVSNIIFLLFKDFGKLVLIAFIISIPIAYSISEKWLDTFVYHVKIGPLIFIISGVLVMIMALISTGIRSRQAAIANPANSLRS